MIIIYYNKTMVIILAPAAATLRAWWFINYFVDVIEVLACLVVPLMFGSGGAPKQPVIFPSLMLISKIFNCLCSLFVRISFLVFCFLWWDWISWLDILSLSCPLQLAYCSSSALCSSKSLDWSSFNFFIVVRIIFWFAQTLTSNSI